MARKLRPDEREAQNRQLPASHVRNLGGKSLKTAREDLSRTPLGAPPVDYDVRSIFDSRPVGGIDFNFADSMEVVAEVGASRIDLEFTVPEGFIAVLRNFDIWFEPNPTSFINFAKSQYTWSLLLNGAEFPYNANIPFGIAVDRETVFLLGDEFYRLGVRLKDTDGFNFNEIFNFFGWARFYGNLLPKTDRPLPFEIANPSKVKSDRVLRTPIPAPKVPIKSVAAAPIIAPAPILTAPAIERPPFPVSWRVLRTAAGPQAVPMQNDRGQRRDLTRDEITRYSFYLNSIWPGRDGRPL